MSLGETVRDPTWLMYTANTPLLFTPTLGNGDLPFTGQGEAVSYTHLTLPTSLRV